MNKTLFSALAVALLVASPALAQEGGKKFDPAKAEAKHAERFAKTDTNNDGVISRDEFLASHAKRAEEMFTKIDADNDGKVTKDEMKAGHEKMRADMKKRWEERKAQRDQKEKAE